MATKQTKAASASKVEQPKVQARELRYVPRKHAFSPEGIVTLLIKSNPKKEGTASRPRFDKYLAGKTLAENLAVKDGVTMPDILWDWSRQFIDINPGPAPAAK